MSEKEPRNFIPTEAEFTQPETIDERPLAIEQEPRAITPEAEFRPSPINEPRPTKTTEEIVARDRLLARLVDKTGLSPKWYVAHAYTEGQESLQFILDAIQGAGETVHIRIFSWAADSSGQKILEALQWLRANKPNVQITVELDWLGCLFVGTLPKNKLARAWILLPKLPYVISGAFRHGINPITLYRAWRARKNVLHYDRIKPKQRRKLSALAAELFSQEDDLFGRNDVLSNLRELLGDDLVILANGGIDDMDHAKRIQVDKKEILGGRNIGDDYLGENAWADYTFSLSEEAEGTQPSMGFVA